MARDDSGGRELFKYAGLGFEFAAVVGLFFYVGYLVDSRWDVEPWGLMIGGGLGLTAGLYHLAKEGNKMMRNLDRKPGTTNQSRPKDQEDAEENSK